MTLTRRSLLGLAGVAALGAGCRAHSHQLGTAAPDEAALDAAADAERGLLARYDAAVARLDAVAAGPLTRARDRHREHLRALTTLRSPSGSAAPATAVPPATTAPAGTLDAALGASVRSLQAAAARAGSGQVAAVLASIAAEHAADSAP